jgi:hypothetical protein
MRDSLDRVLSLSSELLSTTVASQSGLLASVGSFVFFLVVSLEDIQVNIAENLV